MAKLVDNDARRRWELGSPFESLLGSIVSQQISTHAARAIYGRLRARFKTQKSTTTLASLVHEINETRAEHIITLEDPIEFQHESMMSVVNQREIGEDTTDFSEALRRVLRQDPDVIMLGEMRDLETTAAAITAAETGHLVFGTLHTTGAARTMDRIIDQYPREQQEQVRAQLSVSLAGGGLAGADPEDRRRPGRRLRDHGAQLGDREPHPQGRDLQGALGDADQKRLGMQLLDDHLLELVQSGVITREMALQFAQMPADLRQRLDGARRPRRLRRRPTRSIPWQSAENRSARSSSSSAWVGQGQLQAALAEQRRTGGRLGQILLARGTIEEADLSRALALQQGLEWIPEADLTPDEDAVALLDPGTARAFGALPLSVAGGKLRVAVSDPETLPLLSDLESLTGCKVEPVMAPPAPLAEAVEKGLPAPVRGQGGRRRGVRRGGAIVRLLESILSRAVRDKAADVHLEPYQDEFRIRMRSDGVLYEIDPAAGAPGRPRSCRVKVLANLDISETRMPRGRPHRDDRRRPSGRPAREHGADPGRRERGPAACSTAATCNWT